MSDAEELAALRRMAELEAKAGIAPAQPAAYDVPAGLASAMNIGQSLSFGFGDEIAEKLGADRGKYNQTIENFRQEYPKSSLLGTVSGSMLIPSLAGRAAIAAPSMVAGMGPWQTAAVTGAAQGAAQSAGDAEPGNRVGPGVTGGALGMVLGPGILGATKAVGAPLSAILNPALTHAPFISKPVTQGLARNRVAQALMRDETSMKGELLDTQRWLGTEARLADSAGENTRSLLDVTAAMPGTTQNKLESLIRNRQETRPTRLDPIVETISGGKGRPSEVLASLAAQKQAAAAPLYAQLNTMDVPVSDALRGTLQAAEKVGAMATAKKIATAEQLPFSPANFTGKPNAITNTSSDRLSMRDADLVKRGIDDLIESQTDKITGKVTTLGRSYTILKKQLVGELDKLTIDPKTGESVYKSARDAYAGPAALEKAINDGRRFMSSDAEGLGATMSGMSASEQDAFRIGAAEAVRTKLGAQAGQTEFLNQRTNRNLRERLEVLSGGDKAKYEQILDMLRSEESLKRLERLGVRRNSSTFPRDAGAEDLTMETVSDLASAATSPATKLIPGAFQMLKNGSRRMGTPEPVRNAIGDMLLGRLDAPTNEALTKAILASKNRQIAAALQSGAAGGAGASQASKIAQQLGF